MSLSKKSEKWFLVQWNNSGTREVVSSRAVVNPAHEVMVGAMVTIEHDGEHEKANIIGSSRHRDLLDQQISPKSYVNLGAGPSVNEDEPRDFSPSASSWAPSDEASSDDDEKVETKKIKVERYSRTYTRTSGRTLKPMHRVKAVNAMPSRKRNAEEARIKKEKLAKNLPVKKFIPDSTKKINQTPTVKRDTVNINISEILKMSDAFLSLLKIVNEIKHTVSGDLKLINDEPFIPPIPIVVPVEVEEDPYQNVKAIDYENHSDRSDRSPSVESNRSDDNVLITNKYDNIEKNKKVLTIQNRNEIKNLQSCEWVGIGTGNTLIHIDQYNKVKWKSYTIATRTLLLAVFPRRILATHSLTGKRSPAFQDKPAKMCLDPKIVSDVIIEITSKFRVKENLVRGIITTKCADECKMFKSRMKRRTMLKREDEENVPPKEENEAAANPENPVNESISP